MRKLLLVLISIMLLALSVYTLIYGISIGDLEINSVPAIQEANEKLDKKIQIASNLKTKDYPQNVTLLENAYKNLMSEKENYEQLLALGVDENGLPLNKIQEYEIEKIWVTMGNYAKKQGVNLKMDITSNNTVSKTYDLNFTVDGGYIQITDFLYDIERDSTLVFKIENFKMVPGESTENLAATFTCKDIKLNISETSNMQTDEQNIENSKDEATKDEVTKDETTKEENLHNETNTIEEETSKIEEDTSAE